jgi:hypothetical protein
MSDWSSVPKTKYGPGSRLTRGGETRFYIPNYNLLRQDTGGKWVSPEGFKKWWADNKRGQELPDMTRQGVPAGQKPRQPLVKGQPDPDPAPATETAEQKRARERAEIAQRHARQRDELERDFPDKPRPAAVQADIQQRHAAIRAKSESDRIRDRYFYPPADTAVQPKPRVATVEPKPAVTAAQPTAATPAEKPAVAPGLQQWAKLYGPGGKKQLFKKEGGYTPSQRRLFGDLGMKFEAYDLVLDYLLSEGHVDTVEEAHYVMMQMDSEYIRSIVEGVNVRLPGEPGETPSSGYKEPVMPGEQRLTPNMKKPAPAKKPLLPPV